TSWHPATGTTSWSYGFYPASATGSQQIMVRAVDDSGNLNNTPVTRQAPTTDSDAAEVGVQFTPQSAGYITGIRFYKQTGNSGTHVGNLWTSTGSKIATGNFTAESATGWQTLTFGSPVAVAAGTTYVASYFAPNGHYSSDPF